MVVVNFSRIPSEVIRNGRRFRFLSQNHMSRNANDDEYNRKQYRNHIGMVRRYRQKGHIVINETPDATKNVPKHLKRWIAWINIVGD